MKLTKAVRRFDLGQITSVEMTPQGFLKVPAFATRVGVFSYKDGMGGVRRELRHPDDVFAPESLDTLKNAPVTNEHPPVMLDPTNFKQFAVGYLTDDVTVNRDLVATTFIVAEEKAIADIENGKRETSAGYLADLEEEPGVYNGTPYDVRQRNIKYNHVAIVNRGRAGPEVRIRLDSSDAAMEEEIGEGMPTEAAAFEPEGENDSSGSEVASQKPKESTPRAVVIGGESVTLPAHAADIVEDMLDRYDLMRGESLKLQEEIMADEKMKKDVDVSQKGISPQVKVVQMAPDGRSAPAKVGAGDTSGPAKAKGLDGDEHGVVGGVTPMGKADDEEEEKKEDYEGEGHGEAQSPVDLLRGQLKEMKDAMDGMQAKLDEYASKTIAGGEHKMDSAESFSRQSIRQRVKLERQAEKFLDAKTVAKFDSMSDDEIRSAVIKTARPNTELSGKSSTYLQVRFDTIVEDAGEGEKIRKEMGSTFLGGTNKSRFDVGSADPEAKRNEMLESGRTAWQQPLSAVKRQA